MYAQFIYILTLANFQKFLMIKLLDQECIRKSKSQCSSKHLTLKLKYDATTIEIAQIEIQNKKVSFVGQINVFSHIIDTSKTVNYYFLLY